MIKKIVFSLFLVLTSLFSRANEPEAFNASPQMADAFRADGKIYVVISVITIIFLAIVLFLVYLERKIKKLEEQIKKD